MRAPGFPQCAWALEQAMDELAEKLGMDPVQLRLKNLADTVQAQGGNYLHQQIADTARVTHHPLVEPGTVHGPAGSSARSPP